jgi:uncharacterized protein YbjT (DUF2867 family)
MAHILVTGANGTTGTQCCKALAAKKIPFRVLVRSAAKADKLKALGSNIEIVEGDYYKPDTLVPAVKGIQKIFLVTPPGQTHSGKALVDAAAAAGVKHIVKLSALGSQDGDKFIWAKQHADLEDYITSKGIKVTSLRPSSFQNNLTMDAQTIKSQGVIYKALDDAKLNWISEVDIGEAAAVCLSTEGHEGQTYYLTGPDTLSPTELCKLISDVAGKPVNYVKISDQQLRDQAKNFLPNQEAIDAFSNMWAYFRSGGYDKSYPDLEKLLGRKGESVSQWLNQHAAVFK